jgi:plasmid stabilization system protein ParE
MAKRKLIWSNNAKIQLFEILDYFNGRNQNSNYSKKLYRLFVKEASTLIKHPELGIKSDLFLVRGLIVESYILFYEITSEYLIIHTIWDTRQNPVNLQIK